MIFTPRHKKSRSAPPRPCHRLPWQATYCYSSRTQSMHWQPLNSKYRNILLYFLEKAILICI
ncbi:hypothetical protein TSAR_008756 [Trichomalopsis sarcophagae]|uniref:Uncharacterized protein n=1 Tax=Trichomalopsis sarcophagae TaxID=543379 RepID=A0A232FK27_9HYME|nr:hypothetical protein TSAR_008756 [Trichomalopsis sarcophagae]